MNVKQYTRLYFFTITIFVIIAFWQQFKMASLQGLPSKTISDLSAALHIGEKHHAQPDSLSSATTLQRYERALQNLKRTHPEAAKQFEHDLTH